MVRGSVFVDFVECNIYNTQSADENGIIPTCEKAQQKPMERSFEVSADCLGYRFWVFLIRQEVWTASKTGTVVPQSLPAEPFDCGPGAQVG